VIVARWPGYGGWWCISCGEVPRYCFCGHERRVYHSGVQVYGDVDLGVGVQLAAPSEINATGSKVTIGDHCDLAAFVVLNVADSSDRCIGRAEEIKRAPIVLGDHVFVGSHAMIGGGVTIGHHSKIAAGTILTGPLEIPPYSLVTPSQQRIVHVRAGYYAGGGAS
jgi:acetyltransferase-like isoleucine patch superfamily enzyme